MTARLFEMNTKLSAIVCNLNTYSVNIGESKTLVHTFNVNDPFNERIPSLIKRKLKERRKREPKPSF